MKIKTVMLCFMILICFVCNSCADAMDEETDVNISTGDALYDSKELQDFFDQMSYDNLTSKEELISKIYSMEDIYNLLRSIENRMTYLEFQKNFNIECLRKVNDHEYYVILLREDGQYVYVSFRDLEVKPLVIICDKFASKNDYNDYIPGKTLFSDIEKNSDTIPNKLVNIVKEGLVELRFVELDDESDAVLSSITFYSNEAFFEGDTASTRIMPYILEIDRMDE